MFIHLVLAEFEREPIGERTQAGLTAARARGRVGGRPKGLSQQAEATVMVAQTVYRERKLRVFAADMHVPAADREGTAAPDLPGIAAGTRLATKQ